jgi:hypothetical protein
MIGPGSYQTESDMIIPSFNAHAKQKEKKRKDRTGEDSDEEEFPEPIKNNAVSLKIEKIVESGARSTLQERKETRQKMKQILRKLETV